MQNEELQSLAYNFRFDSGETNTYFFDSQAGFTYSVMFKPSGYLFQNHLFFKEDVFEFVIGLINRPLGRLPLADPMIEPTIVRIFQDFFARRGVVVLYICDSSDNRQAIRHRMFSRWFDRYRHLGFVKVDAELRDPTGIIYTSLILHRTYKHRADVVVAFWELTDEINAGK
jgi:Family of unknown function (DUF6169)